MSRSDYLAATTEWRPAARHALRMAKGLSFGGWQPAGFGHAYRSVEPRVSVCGTRLRNELLPRLLGSTPKFPC